MNSKNIIRALIYCIMIYILVSTSLRASYSQTYAESDKNALCISTQNYLADRIDRFQNLFGGITVGDKDARRFLYTLNSIATQFKEFTVNDHGDRLALILKRRPQILNALRHQFVFALSTAEERQLWCDVAAERRDRQRLSPGEIDAVRRFDDLLSGIIEND
jgi:hypothetical protein